MGIFQPWQRIAIFYWMVALKDLFARQFPDFFQPAGSASDGPRLGTNPVYSRKRKQKFSFKYVTSLTNIQKFCDAISKDLLPAFGLLAYTKNPDFLHYKIIL